MADSNNVWPMVIEMLIMHSGTKACFVALPTRLMVIAVLLFFAAHLAQAQPDPALELLNDCSEALGNNDSRITLRLVRQDGDWQLIGLSDVYYAEHDIDLSKLANFKAIESLDVFLNRDYDPKPKILNVESISKLPKLRELQIYADDLVNGIDLSKTKFDSIDCLEVGDGSDAIMSKLSAFPHLKKFSAYSLSKSVKRLGDLQLLESLDIATAEPIDDAIPVIAGLPELRTLDVSSEDLSAAGIMKLAALKRLNNLDLKSVDDERVAALESLPTLENLTCVFEGKQADLRSLRGLKSLNVPVYPYASDELPFRINLPSTIQKLSIGYQYVPVFEDRAPTLLETVVWDNGPPPPPDDKDIDRSWLKTLPNLKYLTLIIASDEDVEVIAGLTNLQSLVLEGHCGVYHDDVLLNLKGLKNLKQFQSDGLFCTEKGLAVIENFVNLERLSLENYETSAEGLNPIFKLEKLRSIHLQLSKDLRKNLDGLFQKLASLENLEEISIPGRVTDEGLSHLLVLKKLRCLNLRGNNGYTNAGLANLMTKMPSLQEVIK